MREQDVLRLEVAVHDPLGVDGAHGLRQLPQEQPDRALAEQPVGLQVVSQVAAIAILSYNTKDNINMCRLLPNGNKIIRPPADPCSVLNFNMTLSKKSLLLLDLHNKVLYMNSVRLRSDINIDEYGNGEARCGSIIRRYVYDIGDGWIRNIPDGYF